MLLFSWSGSLQDLLLECYCEVGPWSDAPILSGQRWECPKSLSFLISWWSLSCACGERWNPKMPKIRFSNWASYHIAQDLTQKMKQQGNQRMKGEENKLHSKWTFQVWFGATTCRRHGIWIVDALPHSSLSFKKEFHGLGLWRRTKNLHRGFSRKCASKF